MEIGQVIKIIARNKGFTASKLGEKIDRTPQAIYEIYKGRVSVNIEMLKKIATALETPVNEFFKGWGDDIQSYEFKILPREKKIYKRSEKGLTPQEKRLNRENEKIAELEMSIKEKEKLIILTEDKLYEVFKEIAHIISDKTFSDHDKLERILLPVYRGLAIISSQRIIREDEDKKYRKILKQITLT
jgi:transcriptional regulator with XRE-family HTH domain